MEPSKYKLILLRLVEEFVGIDEVTISKARGGKQNLISLSKCVC